jgi:DNA polymerase-3 subunit gamma/tau
MGLMSDDSASGLFGDAPQAPKGGYLVLARKYRPLLFADLIGQEAMVRTIANSFTLNRIPHAYILTGVRGVGKTTTARLLARALNYKTTASDAPSVTLNPLGVHCREIMESRHPDVFEMDAASRTGIGDIREILDGVRYAPVSARCKVYIIDEVHMLSAAAFNGLLKTLEEPPPHVKFIFATTEIRKVPVTVLSRCQRFDLKRVTPDHLMAHLSRICAHEGVTIEPDGLALVARAAEGSVRDALSLLDQAIVQKGGAGEAVTAAHIRDMLGLADRVRMLDLFDAIAAGDAAAALSEMRSQYESGADPMLALRDLMEIAHDVARVQALGAKTPLFGGADWTARLTTAAQRLSPAQTARLWQMLLKGFEETARAPEPIQAAEMALVRLCAAASIPPPEDIARMLKGASPSGVAMANANSAPSTKSDAPKLQAFEDLVALLDAARDVNLQIAVERFVRPVSFMPGAFTFEPGEGAPADLAPRLAKFLEEWTGKAWAVRAETAGGGASFAERRAAARAAELDALKNHPFVAQALAAFPGSEIIGWKAQGESGGDVTTFPQSENARKRKEGER